MLLTTITTMAGLTPMMLGVSVDFVNGGYTLGAPAALWWTQLATAIVFGLGVATFLTLIVTPALLAARIWVSEGAHASLAAMRAFHHRKGRGARYRVLRRLAVKSRAGEIT